jgi:hypothetical protein
VREPAEEPPGSISALALHRHRLQSGLATGGERPPLRSRRVEASWDVELGGALSEAGVAVEEETVLEDLLADLANRD